MSFVRFSLVIFILITFLEICTSAAGPPPAKIEYALAIHGGVISRGSQLSDAEKG